MQTSAAPADKNTRGKVLKRESFLHAHDHCTDYGAKNRNVFVRKAFNTLGNCTNENGKGRSDSERNSIDVVENFVHTIGAGPVGFPMGLIGSGTPGLG